ncbi:ATP synthase F0 subunit A [Ktedonosporobacter rubrisoli]|uniref:ATP synthase subunit a n=1 Tax=Ktedonosporobacter rubrisoli TaxID=2509675 RepID=A0A4P6JWK3_KTERU|nr:F0F1 ATP synthase subunit A [Ktedonosporobacter rubrisoli]QBD79760.1 ATP synthase F0 subunit A [Ktedonosporobacter rubrisoli]
MNLWRLPEIVIAPEVIARPFGFPVTNTLLCTWITIIALVVVFYFGTRKRDMIPSGLQNALEWLIEALLGLVESVSGKEKGRKFFPLVATFIIFAFVANLLDVFPGIDTIGTVKVDELLKHGIQPQPIMFLFGDVSNAIVPWFRPPTTDLNLTIAMAVVSVVVTQGFGFAMLGGGSHLSKYFNFKALFTRGPMGIVEFVVGLLEIISEAGRIISFSFRLFGNIFAGSVLLAVFAFLLPAVANIVFIPLEIFVAAVQAFVFGFLTLVFLELGTTSHSHDHEEHAAHGEITEKEGVAAH